MISILKKRLIFDRFIGNSWPALLTNRVAFKNFVTLFVNKVLTPPTVIMEKTIPRLTENIFLLPKIIINELAVSFYYQLLVNATTHSLGHWQSQCHSSFCLMRLKLMHLFCHIAKTTFPEVWEIIQNDDFVDFVEQWSNSVSAKSEDSPYSVFTLFSFQYTTTFLISLVIFVL